MRMMEGDRHGGRRPSPTCRVRRCRRAPRSARQPMQPPTPRTTLDPPRNHRVPHRTTSSARHMATLGQQTRDPHRQARTRRPHPQPRRPRTPPTPSTMRHTPRRARHHPCRNRTQIVNRLNNRPVPRRTQLGHTQGTLSESPRITYPLITALDANVACVNSEWRHGDPSARVRATV